jgi:hypothetical protein
MRNNMGRWDRIIRAGVALVGIAVAIGVGATSAGGIVALVLAGVMAATAAVGFCPLYRVFGISSCPVDAPR